MKLTAKIIALFFTAASLLVAAGGYFSMQRELQLFQDEMARRHSELAHAWAAQIRPTVVRTGPDGLQLAAQTSGRNEPHVRLRWVNRDAKNSTATTPYVGGQELVGLRPGEIRSLAVAVDDETELFCSYHSIGYSIADTWFLELSETFTRRDAYTQETFLNTIYVLIGLGIVAVLTAGLVGVHLVGRPLDALVMKTERAAKGDLSGVLHIRGNDELTRLAEALNDMCSSLRHSQQEVLNQAERRMAAVEQLRHSDRLKTVGRLGAGIAHELGTPLNVVAGRAAMIAEGRLHEDDVKRSAETIRSEAKRMTTLIEGLLNFSRRKPPNYAPCHVAEVVQSTIPLLESFARKRSATITTEIPAGLSDECRADAAQLQQVLSNLVMNAFYSKDKGVSVTIRMDNRRAQNPANPEASSHPCVVLEITDDGEGIPDDVQSHLFEPFFTTRETGEGTGLGLSIVHGIITEHGGWIEVESEVGMGTTFSVFMPQKR